MIAYAPLHYNSQESTAFAFGYQDARAGEIFRGEDLYIGRLLRAYAEGYQRVRASVAAARILGLKFVAPEPPAAPITKWSSDDARRELSTFVGPELPGEL